MSGICIFDLSKQIARLNRYVFQGMMNKISISEKIQNICPDFKFAAIACSIRNSSHDDELWKGINRFSSSFAATHKMADINKRPAILATRQAYKALGKDPNRYRPSSEALCRRIVKGMDLYQIDTAVDLINLVSLKSGYSIGGFDTDAIVGDLTLGVGEADEKFEAIGRGLLNIEGLPVYRDSIGGIGTPTSDEERTKITAATTKLLMIINAYSGEKGLRETVDDSIHLLKKHLDAQNIEIITNLTN